MFHNIQLIEKRLPIWQNQNTTYQFYLILNIQKGFSKFSNQIKPLVQNTTLEFTIKWEETIDNLGRMLFSTLVNHRPLQAQENRKTKRSSLIINEILQEQIQLIYSSTDTFIILCKNIPHGDGIEATKWTFHKKKNKIILTEVLIRLYFIDIFYIKVDA